MTARSRRRFQVTLWTLCCLLVSQWALAAHACMTMAHAGHGQAQAQVEAAVAAAAEAAAHDCQGIASIAAGGMAADDLSLCLGHCIDETSVPGGLLSVAAAATAPPAVVRILVADAPARVHWQQAPAGADATAPPLSILYCVFLN